MTQTFSHHLKKLLCLFILAGSTLVNAGVEDDFFRAIIQDNPARMRALLERGFDPNTVDGKGQDGLSMALSGGAIKTAQVLIGWPQTDVNKLNLKGESPLMLAAIKGHLELAEMLIKKGAHINKTGWTPLHYAASAGHLPIISLLLESSAYIDAESPNGSTPLMMAAMYGTPEAVDFLLQQGADATLKNQQGLSALQFAQRGNRVDSAQAIAEFLRAKQPAGQW